MRASSAEEDFKANIDRLLEAHQGC
jgi:predicted secreted Zn-dependent protease